VPEIAVLTERVETVVVPLIDCPPAVVTQVEQESAGVVPPLDTIGLVPVTFVTQVVQVIVPVLVMVPPPIGPLVAIDVTVPS
tara:strand:- start:226 stop:471 length:246 start_codon:yes stop_codon:yes gene_type:complete